MRRREFITLLGGAAAVFLSARSTLAQQPDRRRLIAMLHSLKENDPLARAEIQALRVGLSALGWHEGRNVQFDFRFDGANPQKRKMFAKELVALAPDVIVTRGTPITAAVAAETRAIPIVFLNSSDPVGSRFAKSLAHPGGNITGFLNYEASLGSKWLELLKEAVPSLARVTVIFDPLTAVDGGQYFLRSIRGAGQTVGVEVVESPLHAASEIEPALEAIGRRADTGLIAIPDLFNTAYRMQIIAAAARYRVPAIYPAALSVRSGGMLSYGVDSPDLFRRAVSYVERILKGEKPANLPVQAPIKFLLTINLKTAKALGLNISPMLLARADEVIE